MGCSWSRQMSTTGAASTRVAEHRVESVLLHRLLGPGADRRGSAGVRRVDVGVGVAAGPGGYRRALPTGQPLPRPRRRRAARGCRGEPARSWTGAFGTSHAPGALKYLEVGFAVVSVLLSWVLVHTVYTLKYARLYY